MPMAMRIIGAKRGVLQLAWSSSEAGGMPPARTESARMSDCAALPMAPPALTTKMTRRQPCGMRPYSVQLMFAPKAPKALCAPRNFYFALLAAKKLSD